MLFEICRRGLISSESLSGDWETSESNHASGIFDVSSQAEQAQQDDIGSLD